MNKKLAHVPKMCKNLVDRFLPFYRFACTVYIFSNPYKFLQIGLVYLISNILEQICNSKQIKENFYQIHKICDFVSQQISINLL